MIPNEGKAALLRRNHQESVILMANPYGNDYTPVASSVLANFTRVPWSLSARSLSFSLPTVASDVASMVSASFTFASWDGPFPVTVYGYYVQLNSYIDGPVIYAEKFASPVVVTTSDQVITKTLTMTIG